MTLQQRQEYWWYLRLCRVEYPETYATCATFDGYTLTQQNMARAETAYYYERRQLPDWGTIIERVEYVNGGFIFVHRDIQGVS